MKKYTIKQLADLAKISVRTLHYYDEIGLLKPTEKSQAGYRFYEHQDLLRLQQVMFFKELGLELSAIQHILDQPDFNIQQALESHRHEVSIRLKQFKKLLTTIDKTLYNLTQKTMLSDEEIYKGFKPETVKAYRKEVAEKWGKKSLAESERRIKKISSQKWQEVKTIGKNITKELASLMDQDPAAVAVQKCIAAWHHHLENFYPVTIERLRGLGNMYVEDERFTAHYEKYRPGLAKFKNQAIQIYCDHGMKIV